MSNTIMSEFEGHHLVESYGDVAFEFRAVREAAGLVDRSHRTRLELTGSDRTSFLQRLVSNDLESLGEGDGIHAALLQPKGRLMANLVILHRGESYLLDVPAAVGEAVFKKLDMYTLSSDVVVADVTGNTACLGLHGPSAAGVLKGSGIGAYPFPVDYLGEDGIDLHLPRDEAEAARQALIEAGAEPVGWRAAEALRIDAGIARFGSELDEKLLLPEVPALAGKSISYTKGCFVGQETIARIKNYGHVNRELRRLELQGDDLPEPGAVLTVEEKRAGTVTSACRHPITGKPLVLAFVKRKYLEPGSAVQVAVGDATVLAEVLE